MAQFTTNTHRVDPYKNFKFCVKWNGKAVAGISKVGALKRTTEVVSHREGGDLSTDRSMPGRTKFEAVTLERGITFDREFEIWANMVYSPEGDAGVSLLRYRKDITIELRNLQGVVVTSYNLFRCWVSSYTALPDLDANANAVAIEQMTITYEGFERDVAIVEVLET
jgi:phage tail-like protein